MADKSVIQSIVDMIMGGKKTEPLRTKPEVMGQQDNTMVKLAAEEAAKRARMRGDLAPEAGVVLATPKAPKAPVR